VEILKYALLGIVQGLTEFLPVSSSGHLVLLEHWLHVDTTGLALIIALHVATTIAVLIVYGKDIVTLFREKRWGYIGLLLLCCAVTAVIFMPFKDMVEALASDPRAPRFIGGALILTGLWQFLADWRLRRDARINQDAGNLLPSSPDVASGQRPIGWLEAVVIGAAMAVSGLVRGFSRSGSTIGAGIQLGVAREEAARFSFLSSVPIVLGGALLETRDSTAMGVLMAQPVATAVGFVCSLLAGIAAIVFVKWALREAKLSWFGVYCLAVGTIALVVG
jgi:undecaprenyl-diphosphatase